jgi:hypothetical protein
LPTCATPRPNVVGWHGTADSKAQLILALNRVLVGLSSSGLLRARNRTGPEGPPVR